MFLRNLGIRAAVAFALTGPALADDPVPVAVDAVRLEQVHETAVVIGRLVSVQKGDVAARTEGTVAEVLVDVGTRVAAGDPLIRIDTRRLTIARDQWRAQLDEARARLAEAEAALALEQQNLDRIGDLEDSAAFSQARQDDQVQRVAMGRAVVSTVTAALARAEAELALAETDLEDATVKAPYDGVVVLRHAEVGAFVDAGDAVVTLLNDTALEIEADVPATLARGLEPGTAVEVSLDDGSRRGAVVRAVGVAENSLTRTRPVRLSPSWTMAPGELADGATVDVEIPVASAAEAVTVSKDAVLRDGGGTSVFVVEEGVAHRREVTLGEPIGSRFVVLSGISAGETVVVRGNESLDDDMPVSF